MPSSNMGSSVARTTPAEAQARVTETLDMLERYRQTRLAMGDTDAADDADKAMMMVLGGAW